MVRKQFELFVHVGYVSETVNILQKYSEPGISNRASCLVIIIEFSEEMAKWRNHLPT